MEKRRAALVLAGGGARGVAHIGAIEELESQGFEVHAVAGTSMGALVGGMYASGHLEAFKEWMYTLDKYKVFSLVDFALSTEGLVKGNRVIGAMKELVPDVKIEQMPLPFAAVAADRARGRARTGRTVRRHPGFDFDPFGFPARPPGQYGTGGRRYGQSASAEPRSP